MRGTMDGGGKVLVWPLTWSVPPPSVASAPLRLCAFLPLFFLTSSLHGLPLIPPSER